MQQQEMAREVTDEFGRVWLEFRMAKFRMLKDSSPEGGYYLLVAPGFGGQAGFAALARGPAGFSPKFVISSFEELPYDSPVPGTMSATELVPASDGAGPLIGLDVTMRRGAPGAPGAALITPEDYGDPSVGQMLVVADGETEFELEYPWSGGVHIPAAISDVPALTGGSPTNMTVIEIPAGKYMRDYKIRVGGECRMEATSTNIMVNLVAHLGAIDGPVIGICHGLGGVAKERLNFSPSPAAGSADSVGRVSAGAGALVYINTERVSGSATYKALKDYAHFDALVVRA